MGSSKVVIVRSTVAKGLKKGSQGVSISRLVKLIKPVQVIIQIIP